MPLSDTHNGEVGANARPHGLTRFESVTCALPGMSETRLIWRKPPCMLPAAALPLPSAIAATTASPITAAYRRLGRCLSMSVPPGSARGDPARGCGGAVRDLCTVGLLLRIPAHTAHVPGTTRWVVQCADKI